MFVFCAGAGLSSLCEQFSEGLCSQWLSSAPDKNFSAVKDKNKKPTAKKKTKTIMVCVVVKGLQSASVD